jgi:iron-sulfur cluster repair protein YtfE (RIC family)
MVNIKRRKAIVGCPVGSVCPGYGKASKLFSSYLQHRPFCCGGEWQIESWFVLVLSKMEFDLIWRVYEYAVAGYSDVR